MTQSMRVAFASRPAGSTRRKLMWSCAAAAILVTAGTTAQQARAQAFQGNPTLPNPNIAASGSATRNITSPTTETITVGSPTATINWTPSDIDGSGPVDFLPTGNVATFTNNPNAVADFTVLNRVIPLDPSRPIALNGTVLSQLQDLSANVTSGGHVWFYSPGGIIVGPTAVFDVGGLLLTVNDPISFSATANGFTGHFQAAANSTANVTIDPGAKINASPENSYVAIVAPRVVQGGDVGVNGSAAYVAGEDVTLTMNQGLFDIAVNVGTSDPFNPDGPNGIVHTGTTGGPASTGAGDNHRIYMVAVPKNQALTMLLSGNAGFTPASTASLDNGTIVLAAGSNVAETSGTLILTSPNNINADLTIGTGDYTSDVRAFARGDIDVTADDGFISFARDVSLLSLLAGDTGLVSVGASGGYSVSVGRNLTMQTSGATFTSGAPEELNILIDGGTVNVGGNLNMFAGTAADGTAGDVEISVGDQSENHGSLNVTGQTFISTSVGATAPSNPDAQSTTNFAGDISIDVSNGGAITLHNTTLVASANGQDNNGNGNGSAGSGFGGNININATNGSIDVIGNLSASADGIGGRILDGGLSGGAGFGGFIDVSIFDGGAIHVTGNAFLSAIGAGGSFIGTGFPGAAAGGSGFGGTTTISADGSGFDPGSITIDGDSTLRADGVGGSGQSGGFGLGGRAGVSATDGTIALGPTTSVSAAGRGGNASFGFGGNGGEGDGGYAFINALARPPGVEQFATAGTITGGDATIDASGTGGNGGAGNGDNIAAGAGGTGFGGELCQGDCSDGGAVALASVDGGSLTLGNVTLSASGFGGTGGAGGAGQTGGTGGQGFGGGVQAGLIDNPFFPTGATDGSASFGDLTMRSLGFGGWGGASLFQQGDGGSGFGGDASIWSNNSVTASSISLFAQGTGGNGGLVGGDGFGGAITVTTDGGNIDVTNALIAITDSFAGSANAAGVGGDGFGGDIDLTVNGGQITFTGGQLASRGNGATGYTAGDGFGGTITASITDLGGLLAMNGDVLLAAFGGGDVGIDAAGGTGGAGGAGYGGDITISTSSSLVPDATAALEFGNLTIRAHGVGGDGGAGLNGGAGGYGEGGTISVLLGAGGSIDGTTLIIHANGQGGAGGAGGSGATGGTGGDGLGGSTDLTIDGTATLGDVEALAIGYGGDGGIGSGGDGGAGGNATGGSASLTVAGTMDAATYSSNSRAFGGFGGLGLVQGVGGWADGGTTLIEIQAGGVADISGDYFGFTSSAFGGEGSVGGDAFGADGEILVEGTLTVAGLVNVAAQGFAGNGTSGAGGTGTGGSAMLIIDGGSFTTAEAFVAASATGGNGVTAGGDATGGFAEIHSQNGGTASLTSSSLVQSEGIGGAASAGTGGSGFGGDAIISPRAGSTLTANDIVVSASGTGGSGVDGGDGFGGDAEAGSQDAGAVATYTGLATVSANGTGGAGTSAGTGGDGHGGQAGIHGGVDGDSTVGGSASFEDALVESNGTGGAGGTGGSGTGGDAHAGTRAGSFTLTGTLRGHANGIGGQAFNGAGGTGTGGYFIIGANFGGDTNIGTTNIATANMSADGIGGMGGNDFGAGGDGTGGTVEILGSTAYGTLTIDTLTASANGLGGRGGDNNGLNGGPGGTGQGGAAILESQNFEGVPTSGRVTIGSATLAANGIAGAAGQGTGGTAGQGFGGNAHADISSSSLVANSLTINANGTDSGGSAQMQVNASTVDAGDITLTATGNFGGIAELNLFGSDLTANSLTLNVNGVASAGFASLGVGTDPFGGIGSVLTLGAFAASANGGDNGDIFVSVDNGSSADLGVANLSALGPGGGGEIHEIDITIGGTPIVGFGGIGALGLENTVLTADSLSLSSGGTIDITSFNGASIDVAGLFHADAGGAMTLDDVDDTAVVRADVIDSNADSFSSTFDILGRVIGIFSVQDLDVTSTILLADETLTLSSDNDVIAGDLSAGLAINLFAGGTITAGDLDSGGDVTADANGNITLGDVTAVGHVDLDSDANILFGDLSADVLSFSATGSVTGGDIVAVTKVTGDSGGAISLGDITVTGPEAGGDFSVGIASETSIDVGNVSAVGRVGFATLGDLITGNITAGPLFMALVSGDITTGSITTANDGRVYMADSSMFTAAGGGCEDCDFDVSLVLPLPPVPTGGSITINGPLSTGRFQAAAGVDLTTANVTAGSSIEVSAGNDILMGVLNSGDAIAADAGGNLSIGNIFAGGNVDLGSGGNMVFGDAVVGALDFSADDGTVTGGDILADSEAVGNAGGAIALGDITVTGPPLTGDDFSVELSSGTSITVGNVNGFDRVGFATIGDLSAGNIQAGSLVMALVGGDITTGSIATAASGQVYLADSSMFVAAGGCSCGETDDFDFSLVLPLAPVATGGSITITGPISTGRFQAAAGTDLHTVNLTAGTSVDASAGHDIVTGDIAFGQSVTLNAGNNIVAGDLDGGHNVTFTAGNNLTVGDVDADGTATFTSVGLASFLGEVAIPTITVTSSDIDVPFGGSLGVWGVTNLLTLNAVSANPIIIGHTGALTAAGVVPQYVLDENGDLAGSTIVINAVGANGGADPDIVVHNVEIDGSLADEPSVNHVVVNTDASVLIDGTVLFTGASATDSLALNAGDSIQVNTTDGGRIAMVNTAEDRPSGVLTLTSDHIWVGSQSLLDQLDANVNFAGRDTLVGTNSGTVVPEGWLIAGGMTLSLGDTLFVQNSGSGKDYAGITVGAGGLKVVTTGTLPAQVVAYGRKMNPDGTYVLGNTFFGQVDFTKATSRYTDASEFNECLINSGCRAVGGGGGNLGPESILGPVDLMGNPEETIEWAAGDDQGQSGSDGEDGGGTTDWSSQLFGTAALSDDALVDEGVTSGGDNNQWESQVCKPTTPDQPCPEPAPPADKQEQ